MGHSSTRAALIYLHSSDERQRMLAATIGQAARAALGNTGTASGTELADRVSAREFALANDGEQLPGLANCVVGVTMIMSSRSEFRKNYLFSHGEMRLRSGKPFQPRLTRNMSSQLRSVKHDPPHPYHQRC
jgi:hypothetical protein